MNIFFPSTRCARHPPHKNKQGAVPAVIPIEKFSKVRLVADGDAFIRTAASNGSIASRARNTGG
jgi:hypothetical protein